MAAAMLASQAIAQDQADTQDESEAVLEEIVVTGVRASILNAQALKRNADQVVDAITMEDIGKYTDANLAETLQRVPGVQIQRDSISGEGTYISLRGLGPAFNHTTVNGRTAFGSPGGGGSAPRNTRALSLGAFPPELTGKVEIIKSPTASQNEGGIGGNINITTIRPLFINEKKYKGDFYAAFSADFSHRESVGSTDPRYSGLVSWKPSDKFAILGAISYSDVTTATYAVNGVSSQTNNSVMADGTMCQEVNNAGNPLPPGNANSASCANARYFDPVTGERLSGSEIEYSRVLYFRNPTYNYNDGNRETTGATITAQWQPVDNFLVTADYMSTDQVREYESNGLRLQSHSSGIAGRNVEVMPTPGLAISGVVTHAEFLDGICDDGAGGTEPCNSLSPWGRAGGWQPITGAANYNYRETNEEFYGVNMAWDISDRLVLAVDISGLRSEGTNNADIAGSNIQGLAGGTEYDLARNGHSTRTLSDPVTGERYDLDNPTGYRVGSFGFNRGQTHGSEDGYQLDLTYDAGWGGDSFRVNAVKIGAKRTERETENIFNTARFNALQHARMFADAGIPGIDMDGDGEPDCNGVAGCRTFTDDIWNEQFMNAAYQFSGGGFNDLPGALNGWQGIRAAQVFAWWMPIWQASRYAAPIDGIDGVFGDPTAGRNAMNVSRYVNGAEDVDAAYLQFDFGGQLGSIGYRGNLGVRYAKTETVSTGFNTGQQFNPDGTPQRDPDTGDLVTISTNEATLVSAPGEYSDTLPSGNIAFDFNDDWTLRFAYAHVMTRPELVDFAGQSSAVYTVDELTDEEQIQINVKDPNLQPFRAKQYEVLLEWYPGDAGASFAVGYFNKDIESFVQEVNGLRESFTFGGITFTADETRTLRVKSVVNNADGAVIDGVEAQFHVPFDWFSDHEIIGRFGVQGNYTKLLTDDTTIIDGITGSKLPFPGTSEDNYSFTAYYGDRRWTGRVSYSFRSSNFNQINPLFGGAQFFDDYEALSLSVSYMFRPGFALRFQATNLLDSPSSQSFVDGLIPYTYGEPGKMYLLGLRYAFN